MILFGAMSWLDNPFQAWFNPARYPPSHWCATPTHGLATFLVRLDLCHLTRQLQKTQPFFLNNLFVHLFKLSSPVQFCLYMYRSLEYNSHNMKLSTTWTWVPKEKFARKKWHHLLITSWDCGRLSKNVPGTWSLSVAHAQGIITEQKLGHPENNEIIHKRLQFPWDRNFTRKLWKITPKTWFWLSGPNEDTRKHSRRRNWKYRDYLNFWCTAAKTSSLVKVDKGHVCSCSFSLGKIFTQKLTDFAVQSHVHDFLKTTATHKKGQNLWAQPHLQTCKKSHFLHTFVPFFCLTALHSVKAPVFKSSLDRHALFKRHPKTGKEVGAITRKHVALLWNGRSCYEEADLGAVKQCAGWSTTFRPT